MGTSKYNILNIKIPKEILKNWQESITLMSDIIDIPTVLINRVHKNNLEVFVRSDNKSTKHLKNKKFKLNSNLYCETVMDTKKMLLVPDALKDDNWKDSFEASTGMISYLGMPLLWPKGKIFGTICILDSKINKYSSLQIRVLEQFKKIIESSLENIYNNTQIQLQHDFQKTFLQNSPIPIFYKDIEGRYIDVNKAWEKMTGLTKKEILGKTTSDVFPKSLASLYIKKDKEVLLLEENPQVYESKIINKINKKEHNVVFYKSAYFDEEKKVKGLIGTILDITKVSELETKLKDQKKFLIQSKMASLGEMIGNIAHQWRQPLSLIVTTASGVLLHKEMDILTEKMLVDSIEKINETSQRMSKTIENFNSFITQNNEQQIDFNLSKEIEKSINIESGILEENSIEVIKQLDDSIVLKNSSNALIQVFFNIINNTKDVLQKLSKNKKRFLFISSIKKENEVIITIKDNGGGIEENTIDKIFEPYFTTKHRFHGTGLGLSISYHIIVDIMKGSIMAENEEYTFKKDKYKGAKFVITLPKKR